MTNRRVDFTIKIYNFENLNGDEYDEFHIA